MTASASHRRGGVFGREPWWPVPLMLPESPLVLITERSWLHPHVSLLGPNPPGTFGLAHFLVTQSPTQRSPSAKTWGQAVWRHHYLRDFPEPVSLGREHRSGTFEFRSQVAPEESGASTLCFFCSLHPDSARGTRLGPPLVVIRAVTNPAAVPSGPSGDSACPPAQGTHQMSLYSVHNAPHRATIHHKPQHPNTRP